MRTFTLILLVGMTVMLLGCGFFNDEQKAAESEGVHRHRRRWWGHLWRRW